MPTVRANGIDICYDVRGSGVPVLLIMGIGCQLIHWRDDFCDLLAAQGCCVIRMDNRDMGLTTHMDGQRPPTLAQMAPRRAAGLPIAAPYLLQDMAMDACGLLTALDHERAVVVGASMGGMIGQTMAIDQPDRVAGLVSIMSHTGERRFLVGRPGAIKSLIGGGAPRSEDEAAERVVHIMAALGSPAYPTDESAYREIGRLAYRRDSDPRGFGRQLAAILASGSRAKQLPSITAPTLVIHGVEDQLIPVTAGRRTAKLIPGSELWEVEGMGHDMPAQLWPALTDRIGAFIRGNVA